MSGETPKQKATAHQQTTTPAPSRQHALPPQQQQPGGHYPAVSNSPVASPWHHPHAQAYGGTPGHHPPAAGQGHPAYHHHHYHPGYVHPYSGMAPIVPGWSPAPRNTNSVGSPGRMQQTNPAVASASHGPATASAATDAGMLGAANGGHTPAQKTPNPATPNHPSSAASNIATPMQHHPQYGYPPYWHPAYANHQAQPHHTNGQSSASVSSPMVSTPTAMYASPVHGQNMSYGHHPYMGRPMTSAHPPASGSRSASSPAAAFNIQHAAELSTMRKSSPPTANSWRRIGGSVMDNYSKAFLLYNAPYESQSIKPISEEEIRKSIPAEASCIFHVLDRRINLDSHPADTSFYALLRSWIQDDPYRLVPPTGSNLLDFASLPPDERVIRSASSSFSLPKPALGEVDTFAELEEAENKGTRPKLAKLRKGLLARGRAERMKRRKKRVRDLQEARKSLASRGIHLETPSSKQQKAARTSHDSKCPVKPQVEDVVPATGVEEEDGAKA